MALDKAIKYGKEHRKPYRKSKAIDKTCRNHGGCPYCEQNRLHKFRDDGGKQMLDDFIMNESYDAFDQEYEEMQKLLAELAGENESDLKN